jgi:hypothetical protein
MAGNKTMMKKMASVARREPNENRMSGQRGTDMSKISTGPGNAMLGKVSRPPSDPTAMGKPKGTDMSSPPKSGGHTYKDRGMGMTEHIHGSVKC